jgi:nucleoside-diphosphate-sugar epimerase
MCAQTGLRLPDLPCSPGEVDDFLSRPRAGAIAAVARLPGPVIVLGAGGKMGLHLCLMIRKAADALHREIKIIAVSRFKTLRDRECFTAANIETLECDLSVANEVAHLPEAATVFFLAGVKFGTSESPDLLEKMNVIMPRLVAERYKHARIVAFSTGCVYPFVAPESGGATEATATGPVGAYAESCLQREQAFVEIARREQTKVALIRLNYSVEFRYGVLVDIAVNVLGRKKTDVTMGYVNLIWQSDAVSHIIQAHAVVDSPAVPVNITGAGAHRIRDLAEYFGKILGIKPIFTGTEMPATWLSNPAWAHQRFGLPDVDLETMQLWIAAWLTSVGTTWGKPTGFEKSDGKF